MEKNIIFCFTGTGNSLKLARDIAADIGNCAIYSMQTEHLELLRYPYERIGFVFPTYYGGLPNQVRNFMAQADLSGNQNAYLFVLVTYGAMYANALRQANAIIQNQASTLAYSNAIKMVSNDILLYDIPKNTIGIEKKYTERLPFIISDIKNRNKAKQRKEIHVVKHFNRLMIGKSATSDKGYHVSDACISCGICQMVCPIGNIELKNGRPEFQHRCEQCLGCVHFCPKRAINYRHVTQKRSRYHNPDIRNIDLQKLYGR